MKCQALFSVKNKKDSMGLLHFDLALRALMVKRIAPDK